jgi:hypothetical protein
MCRAITKLGQQCKKKSVHRFCTVHRPNVRFKDVPTQIPSETHETHEYTTQSITITEIETDSTLVLPVKCVKCGRKQFCYVEGGCFRSSITYEIEKCIDCMSELMKKVMEIRDAMRLLVV